MRALTLFALLLTAAAPLAACDKPGLGEACTTSNSTDECQDGLVCTKESSGTVCRQSCTLQDSCPMGTACNGVSGGSEKSCQPK